MTRSVSVNLAAHLAGGARTIATCWKVTRTDSQVFGFTSHDRDIDFGGVTYVASTGIQRSAIATAADLSTGNLEASGVFDSAAITEDDIRAGLWDHAAVEIFEVNYRDLTQGAVKEIDGWLGEVTFHGNQYRVELRDKAAALNNFVTERMTPACLATLGDSRCKKVLTGYTATGTVTSVTDDRVFDTDLSGATVNLTPSTTGAPDADYFSGGLLTWTTGANAGRSMEVRAYDVSGEVSLQLPMVSTVAPGDEFVAVVGCPKDRDGVRGCELRFDNVVNMRGFPDLPGIDKLGKFGGQ